MSKLTSPRVRVQLEDGDSLKEYEIQTDNRDWCAFDLTRTRRGLPSMQDAPIIWMTFMAWHALHRCKETTLNFDQFMEVAVEVMAINDADTNELTELGGSLPVPA